MSTRQGMVCRAAGALALLCALAGVSGEVRAQAPASARPLDIVPRLGDANLLTTSPPDVLLSEGHALYDAGRYKEAAASFERAMQLGVARPHEAARNVARSYAKLGNRKQASRWAEIAELLEHPERAQRPLRTPLLLKI